MIRFSHANLVAASSLTVSTTTFTETEAAVGVRHPERPFLRAYSPDMSAGHRVVFDLGTTATLDVVALVNVNFAAAWISGHATDDDWSSPSYGQFITITPSPTGRYTYGHRITSPAFAYRYLSVHVATGDTTDGAVRFAIGGIWAGRLTAPPRDVRMDPDEESIEAYADLATSDGRLLQRVFLDEPAFQFTAQRHAADESELAAWRVIDRAWATADGGYGLVTLRDDYPAECFVMRPTSMSRWRHARVWSESELALREVLAG